MNRILRIIISGLVFSFAVDAYAANNTVGVDAVSDVICNVITFVQSIGLPIMTGVIIGSSIMAIFGKLGWPSIVVLVVFTAIFFGASKVVQTFMNSQSSSGSGSVTSKC